MAVVLIVAGLALLVLSGDALVRGAVSIAQRLSVPPIIVGLTVVAFGTSAPELVVSLQAAFAGAPGLALGNVVGSNIANVTIILGLPALIAPTLLTEKGTRTSAFFMVAISAFLMMNMHGLMIDRLTGLRLVLLLAIYLGFSARSARDSAKAAEEEVAAAMLSLPAAIALTIFGVIGLALGGKLTTDGALGIAATFGVAESAVGLTIVALGTSLPELAAGIAAVLRKQNGVAIGNIIGSNIFNILGILGITALFFPLPVEVEMASVDMWIMFVTSLMILVMTFWTDRISRLTGIILTLGYFVYVIVALRHGVAH
ncbi:MAG: calcium/sodium antiporter [Alphaproteobacteria bacterium]|nr:calcium/sodium antiporter [Alphaproteobacteria bacterium]